MIRPEILKSSISDHANKFLIYIEKNGKKTRRELINELELSPRVVRVNIKRLEDSKLLKTIPNLMNMRNHYYALGDDVLDPARGHKMISAGVLADYDEKQCQYCGATNMTTEGNPKDFDCLKNPGVDYEEYY